MAFSNTPVAVVVHGETLASGVHVHSIAHFPQKSPRELDTPNVGELQQVVYEGTEFTSKEIAGASDYRTKGQGDNASDRLERRSHISGARALGGRYRGFVRNRIAPGFDKPSTATRPTPVGYPMGEKPGT